MLMFLMMSVYCSVLFGVMLFEVFVLISSWLVLVILSFGIGFMGVVVGLLLLGVLGLFVGLFGSVLMEIVFWFVI